MVEKWKGEGKWKGTRKRWRKKRDGLSEKGDDMRRK